MSFEFQSLLGTSSIYVDTLSVDHLSIAGGITGDVLTKKNDGSSSWQPVEIVNLQGDASGPATSNRVDSLAGGTIPVNTLVQINGIVNNTNAAVGKVLTCTNDIGQSTWQTPATVIFSGQWYPTVT